jgi:hypothetical protein
MVTAQKNWRDSFGKRTSVNNFAGLQSTPGYFKYFLQWKTNGSVTYSSYVFIVKLLILCRAMAQAINRRFPNTAARMRVQVRSCGIYGRENGTGAGFLWLLQFPLPIIPLTALHSSPIISAGTVGKIVAYLLRVLSLAATQGIIFNFARSYTWV